MLANGCYSWLHSPHGLEQPHQHVSEQPVRVPVPERHVHVLPGLLQLVHLLPPPHANHDHSLLLHLHPYPAPAEKHQHRSVPLLLPQGAEPGPLPRSGVGVVRRLLAPDPVNEHGYFLRDKVHSSPPGPLCGHPTLSGKLSH